MEWVGSFSLEKEDLGGIPIASASEGKWQQWLQSRSRSSSDSSPGADPAVNASSLKPCLLDRCWQFLNAQSWDFSVTKTELPSNTNWSKSYSYRSVQPTSSLLLWRCIMVVKHFFKGALGRTQHIKCTILILLTEIHHALHKVWCH